MAKRDLVKELQGKLYTNTSTCFFLCLDPDDKMELLRKLDRPENRKLQAMFYKEIQDLVDDSLFEALKERYGL